MQMLVFQPNVSTVTQNVSILTKINVRPNDQIQGELWLPLFPLWTLMSTTTLPRPPNLKLIFMASKTIFMAG